MDDLRVDLEEAPTSLLSGARWAFIVRLVTLPVSAVTVMVTSRIVVHGEGTDAFAVYALVVGLTALVGIADLGVGAAAIDAVARRRDLGRDEVARVLVTCLRVVAVGAGVTIAVSVVLAALRLWTVLLQLPTGYGYNAAVACALSASALALVVVVPTKALIGARRNHLVVGLQAFAGVLLMLYVWLCVAASLPFAALVCGPGLSQIVAGVAAAWFVRRLELPLGTAIRHAVSRSARGAKVRHLAGPMLVIGIALPIAFQCDRLVLNWFSTLHEVAVYSLAAPLFGAMFALVSSAGMSLWPAFAARRSGGGTNTAEMVRVTAAFVGLGLLLSLAQLLLGPWVVRFMSANSVQVPTSVFLAFGVLLLAFCLWYPWSMLLTTPRAMQAQAYMHGLMATVNVLLSAVLATALGAAGTPLASAIAVFLTLSLPGFWVARGVLRTNPRGPAIAT